ncbi:hypothetical protein Taro_044373 [Colocasia esculenta]|uniref:CCHC-type domain-containing protein n=1 Tax=Colocasia esculenta TaxID=4460 RepID=A0A843X372_COLES|nr:hypothetical protein [Colocasia esculenta]
MVKKAQLLEDATDLIDRIKSKMVRKEQTSGAPSKPTNSKKRPLSITNGPSQERKPKVPTPIAPNNKPRCKHCDKLGHTAEECWRKVGTCLHCGSRDHRIPECPLLKENEKRPCVDTRSSSVDTRGLPRTPFGLIWDSVSTLDQVVSTLEAFPENI